MADKRVSSRDVAERAGVSRSVVSAILNGTKGIRVSEEKRCAVLQAIGDLNYHVDVQARAMKTGRSKCIAALGDMDQPLFLQVLEGMQRACAKHGYHILLGGHAEEEDRYDLLPLYLGKKIDGIVTLDHVGYDDAEWARRIRELGIPYVSVEGYAESTDVPSVQADYAGSISDALDAMTGGGKTVPVFVQTLNEAGGNWAERERANSYVAWCEARGAEPRIVRFIGGDEAAFRELLRASSAPGTPVSYLLNWSDRAPAFYKAAWDLKLRIGEDVRVMAADNTRRSSGYMVPSLSCMEIPYARMGEAAVERVLAQVELGFVDGAAPDGKFRAVWVRGDSA
ncbi:LacI family DNA-binding transcriptional regulator [Cohnella sp. GCM10027633]|uniref:LacI family DNA-binding transcriptional regulator n=1 Tax=unclassified Cohnella TaxID=2636738 RepID=UPI00362F7EBB